MDIDDRIIVTRGCTGVTGRIVGHVVIPGAEPAWRELFKIEADPGWSDGPWVFDEFERNLAPSETTP